MEEQHSLPDQSSEEHRQFSADLGRLFELGFNTGLLTAIEQNKTITHHLGDLYQQDLSHLRLPALVDKMCERTGVLSTWDQATLERWVLFFLQKGYVAGLNFFAEYLASFAQSKPFHPREIVYLQCSFWGENSLRTYEKNERVAIEELINQFHRQDIPIHLSDDDIREYSRTGNFFKADTLMLLKYNKYWRILSIDLSVFSLASPADAVDLTSVEKIRRMLATELRYVRSKSVFANLSIDTDIETATPEILSGRLQHYFKAFKREDKETAKLIQAASYRHSFYTFLTKQGILTATDSALFNSCGHTDRNVNAMPIRKEHVHLLPTCADIYKAPSPAAHT